MQVKVEPSRAGQTDRFQLLPTDIAEQLQTVAAETDWQQQGNVDDGATYSHLLISRRLKHVYNSSGQQLDALKQKGTTNPAYMHPSDLSAAGLTNGQLIEVTSAAGALIGVVEGAADIKPGVISMAHAWGDLPDNGGEVRTQGSSTNRLVDDDRTFDSITGMPRMSAIPVNIRLVQEAMA